MAFLTEAANRGSIPTGPYQIDNSLKLEDDNQEGLVRNYSGDGDRRTWTYSTWIKRTEIGNDYHYLLAANYNGIYFLSDNKLRIELYNGSTTYYANPERLFRDTSAWYNIVVALDTTQGTAANRLKVWVNGEAVTVWDQYTTYTNISQNDQMGFGLAAYNYQIAYYYAGGANDRRFNGYMAETHMCNGVAADAEDFGEYDADSGIWKPIQYQGSHGTKGFYLKFDNASNLGEDTAGNGSFSLSNITSADQATDTPTNNFCTLNPLWQGNLSYVGIIRNGATTLRYSSGTKASAKATMGVTNGKWYWEAMPNGTIGSQYLGIQTDVNFSSGTGLSQDYTMAIGTTGRYYSYSGSLSESSAGQFTNLTTSNVIGVALDLDSSTQTIKYYKDGSVILSLNLISNMQDETIFPFIQNYENRSFNLNFGGYTINTISSAATDENDYGTFEYAPPSGYYALCTKNLAEFG
ncbi:hypothetical protein N9992_00530 [bacterium]|nr:hypothetical protein [bacterium]